MSRCNEYMYMYKYMCACVPVCTCVFGRVPECVCVPHEPCDGRFLQAERPSSSSCLLARHDLRLLNASKCLGSSFSAKHEAEHRRLSLAAQLSAPLVVVVAAAAVCQVSRCFWSYSLASVTSVMFRTRCSLLLGLDCQILENILAAVHWANQTNRTKFSKLN